MVDVTKTEPKRSAPAQDAAGHGRIYRRLGLRRRLALFFVAMVLGGSALMGLGLWLGHQRYGGAVEGLVLAWLVATLGLAALGAWFGALFDEHVARPILDLTAELETRAHTDVRHDIDEDAARHLGALAPAARAVNGALAEARHAQARKLALRTRALEDDRSHLEALVQCLPGAVVVVSDGGEILLADHAAQACLGPVGLHRPLAAYVDVTPLKQAQDRLACAADQTVEQISLRRRADGADLTVRVTVLHQDDVRIGLALLLESPPCAQARPVALTYDFCATGVWDAKSGLSDLPFVVFDTETTGLNARRDALVQLSAVRIVNGKIQKTEVFDQLIQPNRPIPAASTQIHGITDAMVANAPLAPEVIDRFRAFCDGAVVVAHNAPFDMQVLETAAPGWLRHAPPALCTARLARQLMPHKRGHTLDDLMQYFDVDLPDEQRHTALGDAQATARVFLRMLPLLEKAGFGSLGTAQAVSAR